MSYYTPVGVVNVKSPASMATTWAGQHLLAEQAAAKEVASASATDMPAAATTGRPSWLLPAALGVLAIGGFVYWRRRQKQKGATP